MNGTEAGCCGMAGAFGYEAEHSELSRIIYGQRLLHKLRASCNGTRVVSNGFSCRYPIVDLSERQSGHVIEAIREFIGVMY
jgi:Fe-S oxidoreductase